MMVIPNKDQFLDPGEAPSMHEEDFTRLESII